MSLKRISQALGASALAYILATGTQEAYAQNPSTQNPIARRDSAVYDSTRTNLRPSPPWVSLFQYLPTPRHSPQNILADTSRRRSLPPKIVAEQPAADSSRIAPRIVALQSTKSDSSRTARSDSLKTLGIYLDSSKGRDPRYGILGQFAIPGRRYCLVPREQTVCPSYSQPTAQAAETTRTRADTSSRTSTGPRAAQIPRRIPTNPIVSLDEDITSAGSGYFANNPIFNFNFEEGVPFDKIFYSETPFRVEFRELKRGLENIIRAEGTGPATDSYLRYLIENNSRNNLNHIRILNDASRNNDISPGELLVNRQPAIPEGLYLANISNGTASTNMLIRFNYSQGARGAQDVTGEGRAARADTTGPSLPLERLRQEADRRATERIARGQIRDTSRAGADTVGIQADTTKAAVSDTIQRTNSNQARRTLELGLETQYEPKNEELTLGGFANVRIAPWLRTEISGNYSISKGNPYFTGTSTETTNRERLLIRPGIYKLRTDQVTTSFDERGVAEAGAGIILTPARFLDIYLNAGAKMIRRVEDVDGRSTISFLRNDIPLGNPETISNSLPGNSRNIFRPSYNLGARINLGRHVSVGGSVNQVGKRRGGSGDFRIRF